MPLYKATPDLIAEVNLIEQKQDQSDPDYGEKARSKRPAKSGTSHVTPKKAKQMGPSGVFKISDSTPTKIINKVATPPTSPAVLKRRQDYVLKIRENWPRTNISLIPDEMRPMQVHSDGHKSPIRRALDFDTEFLHHLSDLSQLSRYDHRSAHEVLKRIVSERPHTSVGDGDSGVTVETLQLAKSAIRDIVRERTNEISMFESNDQESPSASRVPTARMAAEDDRDLNLMSDVTPDVLPLHGPPPTTMANEVARDQTISPTPSRTILQPKRNSRVDPTSRQKLFQDFARAHSALIEAEAVEEKAHQDVLESKRLYKESLRRLEKLDNSSSDRESGA